MIQKPYDFAEEDMQFLRENEWALIKHEFKIEDPLFLGIGFRNAKGSLAFPSYGCLMKRTSKPIRYSLHNFLRVNKIDADESTKIWNTPINAGEWVGGAYNSGSNTKPVRVGVIDSGCGEYSKFSADFAGHEYICPSVDVTVNLHGTNVAYQITSICANADIFSARVSETNGDTILTRVYCALIWLAERDVKIVNISISIDSIAKRARKIYYELTRLLHVDKKMTILSAIGEDAVDEVPGRPFSDLAKPEFVIRVAAVNSINSPKYSPTILKHLVHCAGPFYVKGKSRNQSEFCFKGYSAACAVATGVFCSHYTQNQENLWLTTKCFFSSCMVPSFSVGFGMIRAPEIV